MDLQKTDRLYGDTASSLFARRETIALDEAGRSEAFRSFLKGAEARRADERQSDRQSASRREDATAGSRVPARDDRTDGRAASTSRSTDETRETRSAQANRTQPTEPVTIAEAAILAQTRPQENVADSTAATVQGAVSAAKVARETVASTPPVTNDADLPDLPETVPAPIAVRALPVEAPAEAVAEAEPAMPVVQAPQAAADPAAQKKTRTAGAVTQASAVTGKTTKPDATAKAGEPAGADAAVDAVSGDGLKPTVQVNDQMTVQNGAVPTTVEGQAKTQPVEGQSVDARPAGTPPVPSQPSEQGVPALAQNGAATAASNAAAAPAMTVGQMGKTQEPGLESLAADAGRGARNEGEPAAPAASGQGAGGAASAAAASGGAQTNAGGGGNGQSAGQNTGQNAAAQQPQQAAGADQSGMIRTATNDSFTTLLARAQGDARGADPLAAGTARPGEGAVVTPGVSASPGAQAAAAAAAQASAPSVPRPPMPVSNQVAIQLHNAAKDDVRRVTIHLRPEAMGKVEVSMEVDQAGRLQAVISADKAEALDWLRRDAHHLERALQDAGMKMDQQSLSFNLRGDGQSGEGSDGKGSGGRGGALGQGDELVEAPADGIVRRLDALIDVSV